MRTFAILTASVIALAACNRAEPSTSNYAEPGRAPPEPAVAAAPAAPAPAVPAKAAPTATAGAQAAVPTAGVSYWTARKALIAAGYTPIDTPGEDWTVCAEAMEQEREIADCPSAEIAFPEVEACAGTGEGNCRTEWRAPDGRKLTIFTVDGPQPGVVSEVEWGD